MKLQSDTDDFWLQAHDRPARRSACIDVVADAATLRHAEVDAFIHPLLAIPLDTLRSCFQNTPITGRSFCLGVVAGAAGVQCLAALPGFVMLALLAAMALVAWRIAIRCRHGIVRILASFALGLSAGAFNASLQAHVRLHDALADLHQDQVSRLILRVAELPDGDGRHHRFIGELAEPARPGIPSRVQVTWQSPPGTSTTLPPQLPGRVWPMALVLRRPHGVLNPAGPDAEARMSARGLRAVGTVREQPRLLRDEPWA